MPGTDTPSRRQLGALFAVCATLLAYQLWLTRLIAIEHWYHLAPLIIALALLGFGTAGVIVALKSQAARPSVDTWLLVPALATGVSVIAGPVLAGKIKLNMLALPWEVEQVSNLALYAVCFLPTFFFGAVFVSVCFVNWPARSGRVYGVDLLGGAVGALAVLPLIDIAGLDRTLLVLALLPVLGAAFLAGTRRRALAASGLALLASLFIYPMLEVKPAEYKPQALRELERGSKLLLQKDGMSHRYTVMSSPGMHDAPGLSLSSTARAPHQWQLFTDGSNPLPLLLPPLPNESFYRQVLGFAAFNLSFRPRQVLLLEADTLWYSWLSKAAGAHTIKMITPHDDVIRILHRLKEAHPTAIFPDSLEFQHISPRRYLAAGKSEYDVIGLSVSTPEAGIAAMQESYLLTSEGIEAAFDRLGENGVLGIEVEIHSIPREVLKVVATAEIILSRQGLRAADHVAVVRDWHSAVVMLNRKAIDPEAQIRLRRWAQQHQMDLAALPGLKAEETNQFHQLSHSYYKSVKALLQGQARTGAYLFDIHPATDDKPFFFKYFRWQSLSQWLENTGSFWRQHLDWGYVLGVATLAVGLLLAFILLVLPMALIRSQQRQPRWAIVYFAAIGLGFMFVEIGLLQKTIMLLDATSLSMSAVLAAMLTGAGIGSLLQQRWQPSARSMFALFALVAVLAPVSALGVEALFQVAANWPLMARLTIALLFIGMISLPMGMPLPFALQRLETAPPATIAWVWAVNGFASVVGALCAGLIAVHAGLLVLLLGASGCYVAAAMTLKISPESAR